MSLNKAPSSSLQKNAFMATFNCKLAAIKNMFISPPPQYHLKKKKTPKNGRQSHGVLHDVSSEPNDAFGTLSSAKLMRSLAFWFKDCVNGHEKKGKVISEMICNKVIANGFILFCSIAQKRNISF